MASEVLREFCASDRDLSAVLQQLEADINMADYVEASEWIVHQPRSKADKIEAIIKLTRHVLDQSERTRRPFAVNLPRLLGWSVQ